MTTYTITNTKSGATIGIYEGATEAEALDAMARDAGYESYADQLATIESDGSDIGVTELAYAGAQIDVELHRGNIDPAGEGDDADIKACTDYVLDAMRDAFPGATVRAVGNGGRDCGTTADGQDITSDVRAAANRAFDDWCAQQ